MKYEIVTYGIVWSNGTAYEIKGRIVGLSREEVKSQIMYHKQRGNSIAVLNEDGKGIPLRDFS